MSKSHNPDLDEAPNVPVAPPEDEAREVSPFITLHRGFGTPDPADPNSIIFEDFSPRVLPSETPDDIDLEIPTVPKGLSVLAPASSSESPPATEQTASEESAQDELPFPMAPALPTPPVVVPEDGKPSPPASG